MRKTTRFSYSMAMMVLGSALMTAPVHAVEFGAFSDVSLSKSDATGESSQFAIGGFDLYATQQIDDNTTGFIEYVFEDADGFVIDVERLWIKRNISDALEVGVGRFHSPLGFWNRNYHHGVLIQDTVSRPFFLDFEDGDAGVLPMHTVGVMLQGNIGNGLSYEAAIANSSSLDSTASTNDIEIGIGNVKDFSDDKSFFGRLTYSADNMPLSVSGFAMTNNFIESAATGGSLAMGESLVDQTVLGLDLRYMINNFDILAEFYNIENDNKVAGGTKETATAFYTQFGYRPADDWKIIYRFASLDFEATDNYFAMLGTEKAVHHVVSFRYDLDDTNALVLEFNRADFDNSAVEDTTTTTLDWAFMLF